MFVVGRGSRCGPTEDGTGKTPGSGVGRPAGGSPPRLIVASRVRPYRGGTGAPLRLAPRYGLIARRATVAPSCVAGKGTIESCVA
jgi:hypothetical protein